MTAEQLKPILEAHALWARTSGREGKRLVLAGADLTDADLAGAVLTRAVLAGAVLTRADLMPIRDDIFAVLALAPAEVPGLLAAIEVGRVNGTFYTGECACLVGTIANLRGLNYERLGDLKPDSDRPAERWFMGIAEGDTPATNPVSALAAGWVREWLAAHPATPAATV